MHEATITAARSYFPDRRDVANLLEMFNTCWNISKSKKRFSPNILEILWSMGTKNCIFKNSGRLDWTMVPVPGIHTNTSDCFCIDYYSSCPWYAHRRLTEWGLSVRDNCLTAEWSSWRRSSQYRRINGCRFLVNLREVQNSDRILQYSSLLKENINFWEEDLNLKIWSVLL